MSPLLFVQYVPHYPPPNFAHVFFWKSPVSWIVKQLAFMGQLFDLANRGRSMYPILISQSESILAKNSISRIFSATTTFLINAICCYKSFWSNCDELDNYFSTASFTIVSIFKVAIDLIFILLWVLEFLKYHSNQDCNQLIIPIYVVAQFLL